MENKETLRLKIPERFTVFGIEVEKEDLKIILEMILIAVLMVLAYNIGHYDSLQYQKMILDYCSNPFILRG